MNEFVVELFVLSYQGGYFGCSERSRGKCDGVGYIKAEKIANIILNILSEIELPNVEMEFADLLKCESSKVKQIKM